MKEEKGAMDGVREECSDMCKGTEAESLKELEEGHCDCGSVDNGEDCIEEPKLEGTGNCPGLQM